MTEVETKPEIELPEIMTNPAGRRFGCVALTLDPDGYVLMVRSKYNPGRLILPGGSAEPDEAAARWVLTETSPGSLTLTSSSPPGEVAPPTPNRREIAMPAIITDTEDTEVTEVVTVDRTAGRGAE